MSSLPTQLPTDTWVVTTWTDYLQVVEQPACGKAKGYYHNGRMRIEMAPLGSDHANDHSVIIVAVSLWAAIRQIPLTAKDNCTYRKAGLSDAQPDASFYIGKDANIIPWGTNVVDLNLFPPPTLVIEVAKSSLSDDLGEKRLLYEDLQVGEYWVVNVQKAEVVAFQIENGGSRRTMESKVLPGLSISLLQSALQRTRQMNQSEVIAWLLTQFQQ